MPVRTYKPTSPGRRGMSVSSFDEITRTKPERALLEKKVSTAGRNNQGRMTSRHRGGGVKRRSARIALLHYLDGAKRYMLAPQGLKVGDMVMSGPEAEIRVGNAMPLRNVPTGSVIHNIELRAGRGGQIVRSAGVAAQLMAKEGDYAVVRLPAGEQRLIHLACMATLGQVGNLEHENIKIGKAGRSRYLVRRPHVRGSVMNPVDHPHGGGEGRAPRGGQPQTPWGKPALGYRTRHNKRTDKYILRRRNTGRGR